MRRTRALCLVTAATLGLAALTSCSAASKATGNATGKTTGKAAGGSGGSMVSVADAMSLTSTQTAHYNSMKMKLTEVVPKVGTITSTGETSRSPFAAQLTMSNPQLTKSLGSATVQVLMNSTSMYMNLGASGAKELGGKHWMKIDFASLGASGQALSDQINKSNGQDPAATVKLLTSSGDVKKVGQETVDGVPTTHYAGTVDVKKLAAQAGVSSGLKTLIAQAGQLGMTTEKVDMWIDSRNLPVRVTEASSTTQGPVDITIDYSDFSNTPVTITPPPANDTLDLAALLKKAKTG